MDLESNSELNHIERANRLRDTIQRQTDEIRRLQQFLRDIAGAEMIPTPEKAFEWCRGLAQVALSSDPEGNISCQQ